MISQIANSLSCDLVSESRDMASSVEPPSEYLRTVERAFEAAYAVPLVKSATVENESQFTVVYSQPSVAEGKTINYATTFTDDPVRFGFPIVDILYQTCK